MGLEKGRQLPLTNSEEASKTIQYRKITQFTQNLICWPRENLYSQSLETNMLTVVMTTVNRMYKHKGLRYSRKFDFISFIFNTIHT